MIAIPKHSHHNRFKWFMKGRQTGNQIPLPPKKISLSLSANRKDYTCLHGPYQGPLRDIFPKDRTTDHTKNKTEYPHCQRAYVPIYLNHKPPSIHIPKKLNPIAPPPPKTNRPSNLFHSTGSSVFQKPMPTKRAIKPNHPNPTHYLPLPSHTAGEGHSTKPPSPPLPPLLPLSIARNRGTNPPFNVHAPRHVPEPFLRQTVDVFRTVGEAAW